MEALKKILYVDDEEINLMLFEVNFKTKYQIVTALDGFQGLEELDKHPDTLVVISDMKMPGMDGIEFITKAKEKHPHKKFYILTGFEITPSIKQALDSGLILEYFNKPFKVEEMHQRIAEAVGNE